MDFLEHIVHESIKLKNLFFSDFLRLNIAVDNNKNNVNIKA